MCQCVKHSIVSNTTWSKRKFKQLNNIRIKQNIWGFVCFNQAVIKWKVPLDSQAKILEFLIPFIINNPYPWTYENWKTGTPGPGGVSKWFLMKNPPTLKIRVRNCRKIKVKNHIFEKKITFHGKWFLESKILSREVNWLLIHFSELIENDIT